MGWPRDVIAVADRMMNKVKTKGVLEAGKVTRSQSNASI